MKTEKIGGFGFETKAEKLALKIEYVQQDIDYVKFLLKCDEREARSYAKDVADGRAKLARLEAKLKKLKAKK